MTPRVIDTHVVSDGRTVLVLLSDGTHATFTAADVKRRTRWQWLRRLVGAWV